MKGFLRIIEVIAASLILISVLPFFFSSRAATEWNNVVLQAGAADTLAVLEKSGLLENYVKDNDIEALNGEIKRLLPKNVDYSVEISGIPSPTVLVGCVCSSEQETDLEGVLRPLDFQYKQRSISIRISRMQLDSIDPRTRVLFIFGYREMNSQRRSIERLLENGGTVFLFGDLSREQAEDGMLGMLFGLRWQDSPNSGNTGVFADPENTTHVSHRIARYYVALTGGQDVFGGFNTRNVNRIENDGRSVIVGNEASFVKTSSFVMRNGKGRTVWFAGYDYAANTREAEQLRNLTKSMIMWSDESHSMDAFQKRLGERFIRVRRISVLDGFEPFEISLTVWRLFF